MIADKRVARYYLYLCRQIGLKVSLPKSIRSPRGTALEFAKRTFYHENDVSPITIKGLILALSNVSALVDFIDPTKVSPHVFLSLYGFGFRALGRIHLPFSRFGIHKKLRDRLFTYSLIKEYLTTGLITPAMGKLSLRQRD